MTVQEFSNEFDILYNINSNMSPGFNEYEKSVLLTKAQEEIIISLYNGSNVSQSSFEETQELRSYLSDLIRTKSIIPDSNYDGIALTDRSQFVKWPDDLWFPTYEIAKIAYGSTTERVSVVPTTQDIFFKVEANPFKTPNKRRVLRLDCQDGYIELVCESEHSISEYLVRYLVQPKPIILCDLDNVSINGIATISECEIHESLHRKILERAVLLAKTIYSQVQ